jgi:hypothetical protein
MLFDEIYYLELYAGVREAVLKGTFDTAFDYFVECGYIEGRFPGFIDFNADAYILANPDLVIFNETDTPHILARNHYLEHGYREGRPTK